MLGIFRDGEMIPQSGSLHGRGQMGEGLDAGALLSACPGPDLPSAGSVSSGDLSNLSVPDSSDQQKPVR